MKAIRVISNELIEIMEYKNPRICFNDYKLEDIENYCVFKETINPFQLYAELQRKDNIINDLKSSIADYQEAVGDYQDELKRKDNNWKRLKEYIGKEWYCYDNESIEFKVAKDILDKIKELEEK